MTYVTASNGEETLVVAESLVEQALGEGWTVGDRFSGADMVGWTYQRPFELVEWPARTDDRDLPDAHFVVNEDYVTAEDGTGLVHQSPAFGEDDFASCRRNGVAMVNPIDPTGPLRRRASRSIGGQFFRHANTDLVADLTEARAAVPARALRAQLPALLALPHRAALLRPAVVVRPHHPDQGRPAPREREHQLVPLDDQARSLRRLAEQQHRLGALAQPLLGHAAADLALRRGPPDLRRLAGRALRAHRHRPVRPRPAPSLRRRRDLRLSRPCGRAHGAGAGARGDRRVVRLRLDAVRPVGLPARRGLGARCSSRPTRPTSSARRSTRPAAGSTR